LSFTRFEQLSVYHQEDLCLQLYGILPSICLSSLVANKTCFYIKQNVFDIKHEVFDIKQNVFDIKQNVFDLKQNVFDIKQDVFDIKQDVFDIEHIMLATRPLIQMDDKIP